MKIVNWNIEWMNNWFSGNRDPQWGSGSLSADEARICARRAANIINSLAPDLLCIQEGPSASEEMALFLGDFLSGAGGAPAYEALIGIDGGAQKLYALRRLDGQIAAMERATDALTEGLQDDWDADVDGDMMLEGYGYTRQPLVVDIDPVGSQPVRVVILHTKSKFVRNGERRWRDPSERQGFVFDALKARRRISAEGFRLRTYLDAVVADDPTARIVVTGDWNDGPGRDLFERSYLTHNVADIVLGSTFTPDLIFHHPLIANVAPAALFTARFDDFIDDVPDRPLLLDHFAVSPGLRSRVKDAGIAHDVFETELEGDGRSRTERASDHRPIWLELEAPLRA